MTPISDWASSVWPLFRKVCLVTILSASEFNDMGRRSQIESAVTFAIMFELFRLCLGTFCRIFCTRQSLMLENLALRQQLAVLKRKHPRPRLGPLDKLFWVIVRGFWSQWKGALVLVLPETVVRWHQAGFRLYWTMLCKVRRRVGGGRRI